jgi:nucleotide-binding universal stress UspA family protein
MGRISSVLVATDGSETANRAVERAARVAAAVGARVHVLTAYEPLRAPRVAAGRGAPAEVGEWHIGSDSRADAILDEACSAMRVAGVEAEAHARKGSPAEAIIDVAEEIGADLIVVGNKGLAGTRRYLLGSVPDKVSHHAPCSVLIVHTT